MARKILFFAVHLMASAGLLAQSYQASYIPYDWVEISAIGLNTGCNGDDIIVGPFPIGFNFPFYGQACSTVRICSNGFISFSPQPPTIGPYPIPNPVWPNDAVYALWLDLNPAMGGIVYRYHDTVGERYIVEWNNVMSYLPPLTPQKFEAILYPDGHIDLMYHTIQPPCVNVSTVGIENQTGTQALQCTYNGSGPFEPANQTGIRIMPFSSPAEITLTRLSGQTQIPINFTVDIENLMDSSYFCDVWTMVQLPNASWFGPLLGPLNVYLPGGATITRYRTQMVPATAPAGNYWYEGRIGDYPAVVWDTSGFVFTKLAQDEANSAWTEWICTGEPFVEQEMQRLDQPFNVVLEAAFPNPFNASTNLSFELPAAGWVSLRIYDTTGREITTLADEWREAGRHEVNLDGSNLASGIYVCSLKAGNWTAMNKIVLLK